MTYTLPVTVKVTPKPRTLYSLFIKSGHRFDRQSPNAYPLSIAVQVFQDRMLNGIMVGKDMQIRRVNHD